MSTSTASRPLSSRATTHEPHDYPIILGDSLKSEASSHSQYLRLRYNWEPRQGFSHQKGTLKRIHGQTRLAYEDEKSGSSTYDYSASVPVNVNDDDSDGPISQFALIFDAQKSAYVLERISQSFDLNLASAHDQSRDEIRQHKQITNSPSEDASEQRNGVGGSSSKDEDEADAANPFDFRHFLSEAKENAEKAAQPTGNRTPVPGSRTPLSGISSPSLGAGRFLSTSTSQFRPTPSSVPLPKKPTVPKTSATSTSKKPIANKRKPAAPKTAASKSQPQPQPQLSNEIVSDSSDEDSQDTITVSKREASPPKERGHTRNVSSISQGRSPHIVVNNGGLVIDMGSPPPETKRGPLIDRDAFRRSQTHTPIAGVSSNRQPPPRSQADFEMRDRSDEDEDEDEDEHMVEVDVDMDEDVDELVLDSPRSKKGDERGEEMEKAPSPPTPLPPHPVDEYDDDDLAAELAAALGDDDDDDDNDEPSMHVVEDESEVSEEE